MAPTLTSTKAKHLLTEVQKRLAKTRKELAHRQMDALKFYRAMPIQEEFHKSRAPVRIIRKGNRAGGSTATMMEVARAFRGMDPHGKYRKEGIIIWIVVWEEDNIGRTLYRMLFKPGLFKIIKDLNTNLWRAWNPENPSDVAREKEAKPAPPLIPIKTPSGERLVNFAWKKKGPHIFKLARHRGTGAEIHCFCSNSEPPMGDPVDLAVIDEDLKQDRKMISELQARIADNEGKIIWSVWPKSKNEALQSLTRQAEEERGKPDPDVVEFRLNFDQNLYIPMRARQRTLRMWAAQGEDVMRSRNTGDYMLDAVKMYPEFNLDIHGVPNVADPDCMERAAYDHNIDWFLRTRKVPDDWTRFLWIDPGYTVTAGLFLTVPPPELGDWLIAYDEIYLHNQTLKQFTTIVQQKLVTPPIQSIWAFGADWHFGRQTEWTGGKTRIQQMMESFKSHNVRSVTTGHGFRKGSDDVQGRITAVRTSLEMRRTVTGDQLAPRFRILRSKALDNKSACPNFEFEVNAYKKKFIHEESKDVPIDKDNHLMAAWEYGTHDPGTRYHRPRGKSMGNPTTVAIQAILSEITNTTDKDHFHMAAGPIPMGRG